jgi:hypothetical protein
MAEKSELEKFSERERNLSTAEKPSEFFRGAQRLISVIFVNPTSETEWG